jgi:hypothetical protein
MQLLQVLKARVRPDNTFKEWGLEIYVSKDGFLNCDETDKADPFCNVFFNPVEAKVEPAGFPVSRKIVISQVAFPLPDLSTEPRGAQARKCEAPVRSD